jgi:uncharacterized protein YceH (UPF0502 family)
VRHHLERLIQREPALAVLVPRGPGQREDRYAHLLSGPVDVAAIAARIGAQGGESAAPQTAALEARVAALEGEVAALREEIAALRGDRTS